MQRWTRSQPPESFVGKPVRALRTINQPPRSKDPDVPRGAIGLIEDYLGPEDSFMVDFEAPYGVIECYWDEITLETPRRNPGEPSQFEFHLKPSGWTGAPCPVCGCATPNLRAKHRALKADEAHEWGAPYIKRVKVSFGGDFSDEPLKE